MKKVLMLEDNDFTGFDKNLSTVKNHIKQLEPEFDDIFYCSVDSIYCFKARRNFVGEYSKKQFVEYLANIKPTR